MSPGCIASVVAGYDVCAFVNRLRDYGGSPEDMKILEAVYTAKFELLCKRVRLRHAGLETLVAAFHSVYWWARRRLQTGRT